MLKIAHNWLHPGGESRSVPSRANLLGSHVPRLKSWDWSSKFRAASSEQAVYLVKWASSWRKGRWLLI